jgi:hypothetical protein
MVIVGAGRRQNKEIICNKCRISLLQDEKCSGDE